MTPLVERRGGGVRGVFARAPARARFVLSLIEPIFIDDFQSQTSKMIGLYRAFSGKKDDVTTTPSRL